MWVKHLAELEIACNDHIYPWLAKPYSVSAIMKKICSALTVQVISQQFASATNDEQSLLKRSENNSLIRQVVLHGDGVAWSQGRVVVPHATYLQYKNAFDNLGNNLIGETILYANSNTKRSLFEYAKITNQQETLWARRSVFNLNGFNLMVMEAYLPTIPVYPD